jgi:hypothetical protein
VTWSKGFWCAPALEQMRPSSEWHAEKPGRLCTICKYRSASCGQITVQLISSTKLCCASEAAPALQSKVNRARRTYFAAP